jgi:predicted transcriptional regulator with HTH domain
MAFKFITMKTVKFFSEALNNDEISYSKQTAFTNRLSWYLNINKFLELGLLEEVKKKHTNEKYFKLTDKGKRIAHIFYLLEKELKDLKVIE